MTDAEFTDGQVLNSRELPLPAGGQLTVGTLSATVLIMIYELRRFSSARSTTHGGR